MKLMDGFPKPPELREGSNVDTRIWHAMIDEGCVTFFELAHSISEYKFGKAHWGKACDRRLKELIDAQPKYFWNGDNWEQEK